MAPLSYYSQIFHMYLVISKKKEEDPGAGQISLLKTVPFKFLDLLDQAVEFMIGDLHLSFDGIYLL